MRTISDWCRGATARTALAVALVVVACGSPTGETNAFTVGGTVSGLRGVGCVLRNGGGDDLMLSANGSFSFPTRLPAGAPYSATVFQHPYGPIQSCTISNGNGTVANANVTDIAVACTVDRSPCTESADLTSVSGDVGLPRIFETALGERAYRVRITENSSDSRRVAAHVILEVPDGVDYNLFVSCQSCTGFQQGSTLAAGVDEQIDVRWEDRPGPDDSAYILIRVSYSSGSSARPWILRVEGNRDVAVATCTL